MEVINIKCGEIYLTRSSSYYFFCIHCNKKFSCLENFKNHNLDHFLVDTKNNIGGLPNLKLESLDDEEEYQNIEILDYNITFNESDKILFFENSKFNFNEGKDSEILDFDILDKISENDSEFPSSNFEEVYSSFCYNKNSDENNDEFSSKRVIKIEIDNDLESNGKIFSTETDTTISYCEYCELSFQLDEKHDSEKCEIIQNKISQNGRNQKFLQINGIYLCRNCPRYYESLKDLQNHEKNHINNKELLNSSCFQNNNFDSSINLEKSNNLKNNCGTDVEESKSENENDIETKKNCEELKNLIKCTNCGKRPKSRKDFVKHKNLTCDCEKPEDEDKSSILNSDDENQHSLDITGGTFWDDFYNKKNNSIKCRHCNIIFNDIQKHDQNICFKIQKIIKSNSSKSFEILRNQGIYLCKECPRYFEGENELTFHRRKHYNNGHCTICFKSFKDLEIIEHIQSFHSENSTEKTMGKPNSEKKKPYECSYCKRKFVSLTYWKRHLLTHENNELRCEFCNKLCQSSIILKNHLRTHTGERPFICQLCPAAFSLKHNLDLHFIYKHTDERPFECRYDGGCGKNFKTDQLRNYHERRHTGEILGKCEPCGIEYRNKSAFRKHMKLRHMNYNERPYQCEYCDKKFVEYGRLKEHIRTHTGEKPLQCDVCFKSFARYSVLKEHKKLHTGIKSHVCSICGKAFAQTAGYFNHLKYHS